MASAAAQATKAEGSVMKGKQRALVEPLDSTKIHLMLDEEAYHRHRAAALSDKEAFKAKLNGKNKEIPWVELAQALQGPLYHRESQSKEFKYHSTVFNAACTSPGLVLVCAANAQDVSTIIKFANKHDLSISVKSGGYNVAGWTIKGDIIIDCSMMSSLSITLPGQAQPIQGNTKNLSKRPRVSTAYRQNLDPYPPRVVAGSSTNRGIGPTSATSSSGDSPASRTPSTGLEEGRTEPSSATSPDIEESKAKRQRSDPTRASRQTQNWIDSQYESAGISSSTFFAAPPSIASSSSRSGDELHHPSPAGMVASPATPSSLFTSNFATSFNPFSNGAPDPSAWSFTGQLHEELATRNGQNMDNNISHAATDMPAQTSYATVSIGSGVAVRQLDEFTAPYGFYVPLSAYPVGSASMHTGGFGFLSRKHGLTMDNLVGMELVLSDGEVVYLRDPESSEFAQLGEEEQERQKELWWMARGAAPTIGIVTRMDLKAHPVGNVYGADMIFPFNPATTPSLLRHWRDCMKDAPNDLFSSCILTAGPSANSHVVVITICYLGHLSNSTSTPDTGVGDAFTQAISSWQGETALLKSVEVRTFLEQQDTNAKVLKCDADMRWTVRSSLTSALSDECINETIDRFTRMPERTVWLFESAGGAIGAQKEETTCFPQQCRNAAFSVAAIHQWAGEQEDEMEKKAAFDWIKQVICPDSSIGGPYPCFIECDEGADRVAATFGDNWDRMLKVKQRYDPDNVFKFNFFPTDGKMTGKRKAVAGVVGTVPIVV